MIEFILAFAHFVILIAVAYLLALATSIDFYQIMLGITAFQACLATVRAEK